jgi:5,10-methylenetetrahydrofolate reductase
MSQLSKSCSHFVLPDLPNIYSENDRDEFKNTISIEKRIQTLAVCRHTEKSLKNFVLESDKLLIVGGNDKHKEQSVKCSSLTTNDAIRILREEAGVEEQKLWGVVNPNDEKSYESLRKKIDLGMAGFITQPLLSTDAFEIFDSYPKGQQVTYIAGVAMPKNVQNLYFWRKLIERDQDELISDPLFESHITFFEQPNYDSLVWIQKELEKLEAHTFVDGVHFMPMGNIGDLLKLFNNKTTMGI